MCQQGAPKHLTPLATLGEMYIMATPFEQAWVDFVRPLPRIKKYNAYILTLVVICLVCVKVIASPALNTTQVADALINIFTQSGFPKQILTDNSSQFRGKLMAEVFDMLQTHHSHTSPYHPQSNGQVKLFNGILMSILQKLVQEKPEIWDEYLPAVFLRIGKCHTDPQDFLHFPVWKAYDGTS